MDISNQPVNLAEKSLFETKKIRSFFKKSWRDELYLNSRWASDILFIFFLVPVGR